MEASLASMIPLDHCIYGRPKDMKRLHAASSIFKLLLLNLTIRHKVTTIEGGKSWPI
jgi:hypothetical protein